MAKDRSDDARDDLDEDEDERDEQEDGTDEGDTAEGDTAEDDDDDDDDDDGLKPAALDRFGASGKSASKPARDEDTVKDAAVARAARRTGRKRPRPSGAATKAGAQAAKVSEKRSLERVGSSRPAVATDSGSAGPWVFALVALAAGVAIGWFAHRWNASRGQEAPLAATPDPAAVATGTAGTGGPCDSWAETLCAEAGAQSEGCRQARAATGILPAAACTEAMANLPATMAKLKEARSSCDQLVEKICAELGKDTETCKMVQAKTAQFPAARCQQMLGKYDEVIKQLKQMEARNAPLSPELAAEQAKGDRPSFGPDDAPFTIVEYSDFQCPFCSKAAATVKQLKKKYGEKVRFVFRQYPLPFHKNAQLAAEASLAAHAQGKFWAFHDKLFENQKALTRDDLEKYAKEVGLDMAKFNKALDEHTYADEVKADMALGEKAGVSGTPTMMVGTQRVQNPTDFAAVSAIVDKQLAAK